MDLDHGNALFFYLFYVRFGSVRSLVPPVIKVCLFFDFKQTCNTNSPNSQEHSVRLNVIRPGETRKRSDSMRLRSPDNRRPGVRSKSVSRIIPQARKKLVTEHAVKQTLHKPRSSDCADLHSVRLFLLLFRWYCPGEPIYDDEYSSW